MIKLMKKHADKKFHIFNGQITVIEKPILE